jgi:hypothetical protein
VEKVGKLDGKLGLVISHEYEKYEHTILYANNEKEIDFWFK